MRSFLFAAAAAVCFIGAARAQEDPAFLSVGASKTDGTFNTEELAAYSSVASLILNLDETITRN